MRLDLEFPFIHFEGRNKDTGKPAPIDDRPNVVDIAPGRRSVPDLGGSPTSFLNFGFMADGRIIYPKFLRTTIPLIRQLAMNNPTVSQALQNIVSLGNTGHKIYFDQGVPETEVEKMRKHLINRRKNWAQGQAGMHGAINKMFAQAMIGGAVSNEWVVNNQMTGVRGIAYVDPEDIYFKLNPDNFSYSTYQKPKSWDGRRAIGKMVKLNPATYKYFALNGDTDIPYGFPPYLAAIKPAETQDKMDKNINFIIDLLGLVGFLEVLLEKPPQKSGVEKDDAYKARLESLLAEAQSRVASSMKQGVVAGYKEDHEFKFNSFGKDYENAISLYKNNEFQFFSAVKQDPTLAGRDYNTSESQITVIFMKMLSELRNIQNLVKTNLEFGYTLELQLAGAKFDYLKVEFNRSTIQDDFKYQQAEEIKIRNVMAKYCLGTINEDQVADELGYDTYSSLPRVPIELLIGKSGPGASGDKEKDTKNKSAKKSRKKEKPISKKD